MTTTTDSESTFSTIALDALEVGARLVISTKCGRVPYRFVVTERSISDARTIALGELRGGGYPTPRRAALVGSEHPSGVDETALRLGDGAVFLVDPVSGDQADRIVTSAVRELSLATVARAA